MFYIYHYIDPRDNLPFYVGKGTNDRIFDHLHETESNTENRHKFYHIQYLKNNGLEPILQKVVENIEDEALAYRLETEEILKYGRIGFESCGILTNVCLGSNPPSPKGKIKSEIHRLRLSESRIGKRSTDSTKKKNSNITKERIAKGEFGHYTPHTEDSKIKTSTTKKSQQMKWYNNGEKSILIGKDAIIPEGYINGRFVGKRGKYNKVKNDNK